MKVTNRFASIGSFCLVLLALPSTLLAATCTSIASGNWGSAATWSCGARPAAGDTVIITSPFSVTLNNNYSATNLTIDAGGTLVDAGNDLTLSGNAVINGIWNGAGNNGTLIMTGAGASLSGTGTLTDIKRIQIDGNVTIPAGSNLTLTLQGEVRVNGTLNLNGTISGAGQTAGNRILRVDNAPATLNIGTTGVIDAPNSVGEIRSGGTATNGGSVNLQQLTAQGTGTWTNSPGSSCAAPPTCVGTTVVSVNLAGASPTTPSTPLAWTVTFSGAVTGVTASNFALVPGGSASGTIASVTGAGTTWTVNANGGPGDGTLGLSMVNSTGTTPTLVNMPFAGQAYTIDGTFPTVSSITLVDPNPTGLASVSWTVTFSEAVSGVDATDFVLVQAGGVTGATVTGVTPVSSTVYTVTASTGTGNGTLGLNLADNDSIIDTTSKPLGGAGAGNGDFTGPTYSVVRPMTVTASPTLCVDDATIGTQLWTGPANVYAQDAIYAQASGTNGQITHYLKCTGYNFNIPAGATINGITVGVWDYSRRTMSDHSMVLVKTGVIQTGPLGVMDLATNTRFATTNTQVLYGGPANLWGNTWTPADINDPAFGAAFAAIRGPFNTADTAFVDYMPITIDYSMPPTPVAEYRFDESSAGTVADSSANGLNGTLNGGVSVGGTGKVCGGYNFNGTNGFVSVPNNALLNPTKTTVAAWVRHNTAAIKSWEAILAKGDSAYRLHLNGGCSINTPNVVSGLSFGINTGCSTADADSGTVPVAGTWYHVAGTYDGATIKIYVNGVLQASGAYAGAIASNTFPLYIGENAEQTGRYWSGDIDEIKIFNNALTAAEISAGYANENAGKNWDGTARTCIPSMDHVAVGAPANAMAFSATPVVLSPHTAGHGTQAGMTIKLSTDTGLGDWSIGTGTGTLTPGAANSGLATYTFGVAESSASLNFTYQTAGTVKINVTDAGGADMLLNTPAAEKANTIIYALPDYVFTNSACVDAKAFGSAGQTCAVLNWSPQQAGIDVANVYITALSAGIPTRFHPTQFRTRDMQFGLSCHNPAANAGVAAVFSTVTLPLCEANGATPLTWSATLAASFSGGSPSSGPYTFNYADVGNVDLWMRDSAATAKVGASGIFTVAPHHFVISAVTGGSIRAGNFFSATVTAYNGQATPTITPNFGQETPTAESATISFSKCQPTGISSVNGTFSGSVATFAAGTASSANLNWSEVGNGDLTATLTSGSYLGSGLTATGNTGTGGTACNGAGNVGPFVPDHFDTALADGCAGCGFTYSGQPFTVYVTAKNASGVKTANYDGSANTTPNFAKAITLSAWDAATGTAANPGGAVLSNNSVAVGDFASGLATVNANNVAPATLAPVYKFNNVTVPTSIRIRAADADATSSGFTEGTTEIRTGRWRILNAAGSELLPLGMTARVQYYDAAGSWVTSTTDSATTFDTSTDIVAAIINGPLAGVSVQNAGALTVASGMRTFILNAPGVTGMADISLSAPGYLLAGSNGAGDQSIAGRVTFGVYGGVPHLIYQRERLP